MIKAIARLAAAGAVAGVMALAAAAPAGASGTPSGATFGTVAGDAFLAAAGPGAQVHPVSSAQLNFRVQSGSQATTSYTLTQVLPGVYAIEWTNQGHAHGKALVSDAAGNVGFFTTGDLWLFAGGKLTDLSTGRVLCLGPVDRISGPISTVPATSTAACTDLTVYPA